MKASCNSFPRPIMSLDANEDAVVGSLKQSLRQLEAVGAQRAGLEDMLKEMKRKDDILPKLMTFTGSHEDLFRKEISNYDNICEEIAQNLQAQEQLLMHIQAKNDEFAAIFNLEDYKASREKGYRQIEAAIAKFQEIKENINEGLKFYVTLQDAITIVKQQCSDLVMTRNIQCREMIDDVQRQISGFSFQGNKITASYSFPSVGQPHQPQRSDSQPQLDPANMPNSSYPTPTYHPPQHPTMPTYAQTSPYVIQQQVPPPPYQTPVSNPYPSSSQHHQQPLVSHDYGQPAYPGWRGPYYNASQQSRPMPQPSYTVQPPYPPPPHQSSGYYRQ